MTLFFDQVPEHLNGHHLPPIFCLIPIVQNVVRCHTKLPFQPHMKTEIVHMNEQKKDTRHESIRDKKQVIKPLKIPRTKGKELKTFHLNVGKCHFVFGHWVLHEKFCTWSNQLIPGISGVLASEYTPDAMCLAVTKVFLVSCTGKLKTKTHI